MTQTAEGYRPPAGWYPDAQRRPGAALVGRRRVRRASSSRPPCRGLGAPGPAAAAALVAVAVVGGVVLLVLALAVGLVRGALRPGPVEPGGLPTDFGQQDAPSTDYLLSLIGQDSSSDAVRQLDQQCGNNLDAMGNLECPSLGFEITFDTSLTATRVVLYPFQQNSMAEYAGALPGGVAWSDGYPDVVARLGEPAELEGGFGAIDITAHYQLDGYDVGYGLDTWYNSPDDLQNAHLTSITIQPSRPARASAPGPAAVVPPPSIGACRFCPPPSPPPPSRAWPWPTRSPTASSSSPAAPCGSPARGSAARPGRAAPTTSFVATPELAGHGVIEFGNRLLTFVLTAVAIATVVVVFRSVRRDLRTLAVIGFLGIPAQALLGGVTVLTGLNPWTVAAHFLLSMVLVAVAHDRCGCAPANPGVGQPLLRRPFVAARRRASPR